jgi:crotonobetainyl-CoA:carnitine CoA-transferase CaiB-like acyl-CoA transferase
MIADDVVPAATGEGPASHFLDGITVLELGDGVAGAAATSVLRSYGADVTTVLLSQAVSHRLEPLVTLGDDTDSTLSLLLRSGKHIVADGPGPDPGTFDIVVFDRIDQAASGADVEHYLRDVAASNANVWVTISAFGLSGPQRDHAATDFVLAAAGGLLGAVTDPAGRRPVKLPGSQSLLAAGHVAALAACHGLDEARRRGSPVHVDVSGQEAVIATGPVLGLAQALLNTTAAGGVRRVAPSGFIRCRDGLVRVVCSENHQWAGMVRVLGSPDWAIQYVTNADRVGHAEEIDNRLDEAFAQTAKADCEQRLQEAGVPATVMCGPAELLRHRQFLHRGAVGRYHVRGLEFEAVSSPMRVTTEASGSGSARRGGLAGLKITEFGHVLAVPMAAAFLGAMGASVTKVEDAVRQDTYRRNGPFVDDVAGADRGVYFAVANHSKQSLTIDMSAGPQALAAALDGADVVLENFGPSRAGRLGIDAATLHEARPSMLAISVSGFGHTGPSSRYRSYAYNLHSACGLLDLLRSQNGELTEVDLAWADLVSTVAIATAVAAWAVGPGSGAGACIDLSMAEQGAQRFNEYLAAESRQAGAGRPDHGGNHQAPFAPQQVYQTGDGRWLAVSVYADSAWARLVEALGSPPELLAARFDTACSRAGHQDDLDIVLARLIRGHQGGELASRLQAAGVAATMVATPADLIKDEHLSARGFFGAVTHPQWGRRQLLGLPWRFAGEDPIPLGAPPELQQSAVTAARPSANRT